MNTRALLVLIVFIVSIVAGLAVYRTSHLYGPTGDGTSTTSPGGGVACAMDAKICPDGSAVGRSGPNCEFAACPETATSTSYHKGDTVTVTARLGQSVTALGEVITPTAVLDDSRCPIDVQCIWAGTLHLRATVKSGMGTGTIVFELGVPGTTEVNIITLESVAPAQTAGQQTNSGDYWFTFGVVRR